MTKIKPPPLTILLQCHGYLSPLVAKEAIHPNVVAIVPIRNDYYNWSLNFDHVLWLWCFSIHRGTYKGDRGRMCTNAKAVAGEIEAQASRA